MNLLETPWIPIVRKSGKEEMVAPDRLTDRLTEDPIVSIDAKRPDLETAVIQFLIGLLQTSFAPKDERQWRDLWKSPPNMATLKSAFAQYREAFNLDGEGPRFMQDRTLAAEPKARDAPIGLLLIDDPGENGPKNNTDHFVKEERFDVLSVPFAAMALMALQINAPSGGSGHRTSLRGGGPLTTLLVPDGFHSLWDICWLNVLPADRIVSSKDKTGKGDIFPWLGGLRTSEKDQTTTPEDVSPLQAYWGTPRRLLLETENQVGICALSGESGPVVKKYRTLNYGINYEGAWHHPLSPYYFSKEGLPLCIHPQPEGIGYRHWLGLVFERSGKEHSVPAQVVAHHVEYRKEQAPARLWAFGYDMDNMKARGWHDALMPLYGFADRDRQEDFALVVEQLIHVAQDVAYNLRSRIKEAWGDLPKGDLSFASDSFWDETEADFYATLDRLYRQIENQELAIDDLKEAWFRVIRDRSIALFERLVEGGDFAFENPKRVYQAKKKLISFNYKAAKDWLGIERKEK